MRRVRRPRGVRRPSGSARRPGAALLEALVALTILGVAGLSALASARQAAQAVEAARRADDETRAASAFLDAVALWPRADLDRHLGVRAEGRWHLRVDRPAPTVYTVTLTDTLDARVLLATALYRPEVARAAP